MTKWTREYRNAYQTAWRHKRGDSIKYNTGISKLPGYKRPFQKQCKHNRRNAGLLTIGTVQKVYEDNIKLFGTLTCIYCLNPISFGKDTLEHVYPVCKGGTNERSNLDIACIHCNCMKHKRTYEEVIK